MLKNRSVGRPIRYCHRIRDRLLHLAKRYILMNNMKIEVSIKLRYHLSKSLAARLRHNSRTKVNSAFREEVDIHFLRYVAFIIESVILYMEEFFTVRCDAIDAEIGRGMDVVSGELLLQRKDISLCIARGAGGRWRILCSLRCHYAPQSQIYSESRGSRVRRRAVRLHNQPQVGWEPLLV